MKKMNIIYIIKNGESIPVDYTDVDQEEMEAYGSAAFNSYFLNKFADLDGEEQEKAIEDFASDAEFAATHEPLDIIVPDYYKEDSDGYDSVAYLVVDRRKKEDDAFIGLYASEFDAWNKVHSIISEEDLEFAEPAPVYYVRLFKLMVKNVMPIGEPFYAKYNFEKMKFDVD